MKYIKFSTEGKELQIKDGVFRYTTDPVNYILDVDQIYLQIGGIWRAYTTDIINQEYNSGKTLRGTKSTVTTKLEVVVTDIPTGTVATSSNPTAPKVHYNKKTKAQKQDNGLFELDQLRKSLGLTDLEAIDQAFNILEKYDCTKEPLVFEPSKSLFERLNEQMAGDTNYTHPKANPSGKLITSISGTASNCRDLLLAISLTERYEYLKYWTPESISYKATDKEYTYEEALTIFNNGIPLKLKEEPVKSTPKKRKPRTKKVNPDNTKTEE